MEKFDIKENVCNTNMKVSPQRRKYTYSGNKNVIAALVVIVVVLMVLLLAVAACCIYFGLEISKLKSETTSAQQIISTLADQLNSLNTSVDTSFQQLFGDGEIAKENLSNIADRLDSLIHSTHTIFQNLLEIDSNAEQLNTSLYQEVSKLHNQAEQIAETLGRPGQNLPISSCVDLPHPSLSGHYWVRISNSSAVCVYCDMNETTQRVQNESDLEARILLLENSFMDGIGMLVVELNETRSIVESLSLNVTVLTSMLSRAEAKINMAASNYTNFREVTSTLETYIISTLTDLNASINLLELTVNESCNQPIYGTRSFNQCIKESRECNTTSVHRGYLHHCATAALPFNRTVSSPNDNKGENLLYNHCF